MRIPLLRGRLIEATDQEGAPLVMLVNEMAVRRYWQGRDPIAYGDVKHFGLEEGSRPEAYRS